MGPRVSRRVERANEKGATHFGTATSTVSKYSESFVPAKSSSDTTSAKLLIDRLPLRANAKPSAASFQPEPQT